MRVSATAQDAVVKRFDCYTMPFAPVVYEVFTDLAHSEDLAYLLP